MDNGTAVRRLGGAVLVLLLMAACGGGASGDTAADPQVPAEVAEALRNCMTDAGFAQFANGTVGAPGQDPIWDDDKFSAAYRRCEVESGIVKFAPKEKHGDEVDVEAVNRQNVALVSCIRSRGWKVPDPEPSANGTLVPRFPQLATREEQVAFNQDLQSCGKVAGVQVDDPDASHHPQGTQDESKPHSHEPGGPK